MGIVLWLPCIFLISEAFPSLFFWKRRYEFSYKKISSRHSHNGGRWIWKEDKRLNKSSLKFPLTISCSKSRFVATITRTSTCIRVSTTNFHKLPGLKNTRNRVCKEISISPISSKNIVPPFASSKSPFVSVIAPAKNLPCVRIFHFRVNLYWKKNNL